MGGERGVIWEYAQPSFSKHKKIPRSTHTRYTLEREMLQELPPSAGQAQRWGGKGGARPSRTPRGEKEPKFMQRKQCKCSDSDCWSPAQRWQEDMPKPSLGRSHVCQQRSLKPGVIPAAGWCTPFPSLLRKACSPVIWHRPVRTTGNLEITPLITENF